MAMVLFQILYLYSHRVDVTEVSFAIGIMILLLFHYNYQVGSEDTDITVYLWLNVLSKHSYVKYN
jgi:hypothetical protein